MTYDTDNMQIICGYQVAKIWMTCGCNVDEMWMKCGWHEDEILVEYDILPFHSYSSYISGFKMKSVQHLCKVTFSPNLQSQQGGWGYPKLDKLTYEQPQIMAIQIHLC